jgi:processing peptidase subunit beta
MVLVDASGIDHGELVKAVEKAFGTLPVSLNPNPLGHEAHPKPDFIGLEVHKSDDDIPMTHIAVAIEGISQSLPNYYPMLIVPHHHCLTGAVAKLGCHVLL